MLLFSIFAINGKTEEKGKPKIAINGDYFALLLDDEVTTTIPNAGTYLVDYTCDNGSEITWNRETGELSLSKNTLPFANTVIPHFTHALVLFKTINLCLHI